MIVGMGAGALERCVRLSVAVAVGAVLLLPAGASRGAETGFLSYAPAQAGDQVEGRRLSSYVPMRDGVARAVDVFLHLRDGRPDLAPRPVIYLSDRYIRAFYDPADESRMFTRLGVVERGGRFRLPATGPEEPAAVEEPSMTRPQAHSDLQWLFRHGYNVVVADMRGAGASYGFSIEQTSREALNDEHDLIDWIARQPWSDGKVGMIGVSYGAESQYFAAAAGSPHLRAIFPIEAEFDQYYGDGYGTSGISQIGFQLDWVKRNVPTLEDVETIPALAERLRKGVKVSTEPAPDVVRTRIVPVDGDEDRARLRVAFAQRYLEASQLRDGAQRLSLLEKQLSGTHFYDSLPGLVEFQERGSNSLHTLLPALNRRRVPTYVVAGLYDLYTNGNLRLFDNLRAPKKLVLLPIGHGEVFRDRRGDERNILYRRVRHLESLRWFDHWLRGQANGVMDNAPVAVAAATAGQQSAWKFADAWPLPGTFYRSMLFAAGPSGSAAASQFDGRLQDYRFEPVPARTDLLTVDYAATTGSANRWQRRAAEGGEGWEYGDRAGNAAHGITYTSAPLEHALNVIGHPAVRLYVTSTAKDVDLYAYLEEVRPDGSVQYVTEGMVRASHRVVGRSRYGNQGMPFPLSYSHIVAAAEPLNASDRPVLLDFELIATANRFDAGNRIRVTITGADAGNTSTTPQAPAPLVRIHSGYLDSSYIDLPVYDD